MANELKIFDINNESNEIKMTSMEVVDLINKFRLEEGNNSELTHGHFMRDIRKDVESLTNVGISTESNFGLSSYKSGNRNYDMYILNKSGVMQMLNKESAVVRYKTQQYIEALENKLKDNTPSLSEKDLLSLTILNSKNEVERILALKQFEDFVANENKELGIEIGKNIEFENTKNERVTPLVNHSFICDKINIDRLSSTELMIFLEKRGLGSRIKPLGKKKYMFIINDNFRNHVINNGWAKEVGNSFKFYEAFADIINDNLDVYKSILFDAIDEYRLIYNKNKDNDNMPF